jgi:hypothetical protein
MRRKKRSNRRLLDELIGERPHGDVLGILTTSYEFDPDFFERDYLPGLLGVGSWEDSDGQSRVALENRLADLDGAWIATDHRAYKGRPQSLRVETRTRIGEGGAMLHAKVTVLVHERAVRVLVGSANLTSDGYRHNREVMTGIVASKDNPEHTQLASTALAGLRSRLQPWWTESAERVAKLAEAKLAEYPRSTSTARFAWSDTASPLWRQIVDAWPADEVVESITVVSPFWSEEGTRGPIRMLAEGLRAKNAKKSDLRFLLCCEAQPHAQGLQPAKPRLGSLDLTDLGVRIAAQAVDPNPADDGAAEETRPRRLHAKVVLLQGRSNALAYVGSANFTRNGLGCPGARANIEAGMILLGDAETLRAAVLPPTKGPVVELGSGASDEGAASEDDDRKVPTFLLGAWLEPTEPGSKILRLRLELDATRIHGKWSAHIREKAPEESTRELLDGDVNDPQLRTVALAPAELEALLCKPELYVSWWEASESAPYPVNVEASARHDLPLSPGAGNPDESALLNYYQGRIRFEDMFPVSEYVATAQAALSPMRPQASRVDTSKIQSYQVKSFVEALAGLRQDLERAAKSTKARMQRAVLGPISPLALAREVVAREQSGARSPVAAGFELVEILLCIQDARTAALESEDWRNTADQGIEAIRSLLREMSERRAELRGAGSAFKTYASHALQNRNGRLAP